MAKKKATYKIPVKHVVKGAFNRALFNFGSTRFQLMVFVMIGAVYFSIFGKTDEITKYWMDALYIILGCFFASKTIESFSKNGVNDPARLVDDDDDEEPAKPETAEVSEMDAPPTKEQ